ncbi:DNA (cytosine-5)-methyltransferase CMT2-like [Pyrus ussuriensis x Pyrus communis]|uniref:DNA (cytosine-5-)-methyltransferase n=1 Tax=Pyrus ussuriensis x Pyrus communis TaxID=2448454 RepID=A0A5N5HX49_9ROSA|nr:DNA (cytosine-5)-methyltransferase CMT2-like [Pyrus ussuriensis x Pyrus communis]
MDIVNFLKPKFVLMENVVDILRFEKASLGSTKRGWEYLLLVVLAFHNFGCVFSCGNLPQFPLPTHDVIMRYWPPPEFERNTVAYDEEQPRELLEKALVLRDAISDLPSVSNDEKREEMPFQKPPETDFQRYIRSTQHEMMGSAFDGTTKAKVSLYDHRTYHLYEDDYLRVCQIPKRKGANFRDLPGVVVGSDNVARRESTEKHSLLPSGRPLVPDYCFTYEQGKSKRPFARLWWDETVPTVLTFPSCHNQVVLHPEQDRILTVRESARLQGFPDYYRFCGTVKERYCQIGNAVPVSVARALGYALGLAVRKLSGNDPLMTLPNKFSHSNFFQFTKKLPLETEE